MNSNNVNDLISFSKLPPASRTLIDEYYNDPELSVFARQALSSKSFYHPDGEQTRNVIIDAIDQAIQDNDYRGAIQKLNQNLTNLMYNN